jgi:uncharacterized protein YjiS (DUF1127 family)
MLEQSLHSSFGLSLLDRRGDDRRGDDRRGPARLPGTVCASSVRTFDPVTHYGSPLWASPGMRLTAQAPRHARTRHSAVLTAIRQAVAAIRLWRERARSRQGLRELSDHMLEDIGLRREEVGYGFPTSFWHCD